MLNAKKSPFWIAPCPISTINPEKPETKIQSAIEIRGLTFATTNPGYA